MKHFKRHKDYGFFDQDIRLSKLSQLGDPLEKLNAGVDFLSGQVLTIWVKPGSGILNMQMKKMKYLLRFHCHGLMPGVAILIFAAERNLSHFSEMSSGT